MQKVINLSNFFKIIRASGNNISYTYEKASQIIFKNIQMQWLQFTLAKTYQHLPVFMNKSKIDNVNQRTGKPYGYINQNTLPHNNHLVEYNLDETSFKTLSELCLTIAVPTQDIMPYFMQWQRYRKYWWSSITTTPSLFTISDIKDNGKTANANIFANFNWGMKVVETLTIDVNSDTKMSTLSCKMTLEDALFTILLDGLNNRTKEEYLRLHNKMAPYKVALALDYQDSKLYNNLKELATLMMHKLEEKNISTRTPDTLIPLNLQLILVMLADLQEINHGRYYRAPTQIQIHSFFTLTVLKTYTQYMQRQIKHTDYRSSAGNVLKLIRKSNAKEDSYLHHLVKHCPVPLGTDKIVSELGDLITIQTNFLQLKDNFQMGVTYTAIIAESTLTNGVFQLLNSSTMLKEHLHLIDFDSYAALLCGK